MKNTKVIALICGLTAVSVTVIFYLLAFDTVFSIPMRWLSLSFILFAECLGTLKALLLKNRIIANTCSFTSAAHIATVLLLSVIFVNLFPFSIRIFILLNILILCLLTAIDLIILHFDKIAYSDGKKLSQSQGVIDACYVKLQGIIAAFGDSEHKPALLSIAGSLRYSDTSELTGDEASIMNSLAALENELGKGGENVLNLIQEIKNTVELRSLKIKNNKRGSY